MRLRYGLNIGDRWRDLAFGPASDLLVARIRDAGTERVRVFLDPAGGACAGDSQACARLIEAIGRAGATPMISLCNPTSGSDAQAVRRFAEQCGDFVDRCGDQFGGRAVASWFWSIGDEPNSPWTNGGLTFENYRDIYEATAYAICRRVGPPEGRPRIGGPCVDGFQPFWFDWIWRFTEEIDDALLGFVAWNRYGDWREPGSWSAPTDADIFERLLLSRTGEYWSRAETIAALLGGRGILSLCTELNAHSHTDPAVSGRFNQGMFGAVYYGSALIELMRGGADGEFLWTGACDAGPSAALDTAGGTTPTYEAKRLIAQHVRFGDVLFFPLDEDPEPALDVVLTAGEDHRVAVVVHRGGGPRSFDLQRWPALAGFSHVTLMSGNGTRHLPCDVDVLRNDVLGFDGYGVALLRDRVQSDDRASSQRSDTAEGCL